MTLARGARVAIIGAGPSGLVTARFALEAGFDTTVFEAGDDLGGQWHATAAHSGIWPGMHANTSRAMTAFSDLAPAPGDPPHPSAEEVHAYLRSYAEAFRITEHIRLRTPVRRAAPGFDIDGEPFDALVIASGRFRAPVFPPGLDAFTGELLHGYHYPGAEAFRGQSILVYGYGVSALEIASDLARTATVTSACRKPRYVIQKLAGGVASDWQWYTHFGALERRNLSRGELSATLRERVLRIAGNPAQFGAPEPGEDLLVAGLTLSQDFLELVAQGSIACRPAIAAVQGRVVTFTDGTQGRFDAIVCATGYALDIPYLAEELWAVLGRDLRLYRRTLHPDLPGLGVVGQFFAQGPYFPLLELQARWIVALWAGEAAAPDAEAMRAALEPPAPIDAHNALALTLSEELGVTPDLLARPELTESLLFGPMLPARYRLDGPGARADAGQRFSDQLATMPRAPVEPGALVALRRFGLTAEAELLSASPPPVRARGRA